MADITGLGGPWYSSVTQTFQANTNAGASGTVSWAYTQTGQVDQFGWALSVSLGAGISARYRMTHQLFGGFATDSATQWPHVASFTITTAAVATQTLTTTQTSMIYPYWGIIATTSATAAATGTGTITAHFWGTVEAR
jgi:hypothetical protein